MTTPPDDANPLVARQLRREPLLMLLSRMQRGVLLDAERPLLRAAVETELADGDDAHERAEAVADNERLRAALVAARAENDGWAETVRNTDRLTTQQLAEVRQRAERAEATLTAVAKVAFDAEVPYSVRVSQIRNLIDPADQGDALGDPQPAAAPQPTEETL